MTFPLDEPHLAALRWACSIHFEIREHAWREYSLGCLALDPAEVDALQIISSPSASAQLVRDLLGACGCEADTDWADAYPEILIGFNDTEGISWDVLHSGDRGATPTPDIPALIIALLDALAKTEGRAEAALKALWEAGR